MKSSLLLKMLVIFRCLLFSLLFFLILANICSVFRLSFSESELCNRLGILGLDGHVSGAFYVSFLSLFSVEPGSFHFPVLFCVLH